MRPRRCRAVCTQPGTSAGSRTEPLPLPSRQPPRRLRTSGPPHAAASSTGTGSKKMAARPMAAGGTERGRPATSAPGPGRRLGLLPPAVNGAEGGRWRCGGGGRAEGFSPAALTARDGAHGFTRPPAAASFNCKMAEGEKSRRLVKERSGFSRRGARAVAVGFVYKSRVQSSTKEQKGKLHGNNADTLPKPHCRLPAGPHYLRPFRHSSKTQIKA